MLLDVTLHLLHPGPCWLAGDFQPEDCHRRGEQWLQQEYDVITSLSGLSAWMLL